MLKFMVVLYRRPGMSRTDFARYLREVHGPMAQKLPGLRKYTQNYVADDPARKHPGWDAIIELYWDNWNEMEAAWKTPAGEAATKDLEQFADLDRTNWSVVDEWYLREP
jgi:uncharacterized protein (TIGR02118 family)